MWWEGLASGAHGLPRQTNGVDIVADVTKDGARELCEALGTCFYADAEEVTRAIEDGRPFNVIQGVIQVQSSRLDQAYLDRWAAELGITDLLKRAFS